LTFHFKVLYFKATSFFQNVYLVRLVSFFHLLESHLNFYFVWMNLKGFSNQRMGIHFHSIGINQGGGKIIAFINNNWLNVKFCIFTSKTFYGCFFYILNPLGYYLYFPLLQWVTTISSYTFYDCSPNGRSPKDCSFISNLTNACFPLPNPSGHVSPSLTLHSIFPLPNHAWHFCVFVITQSDIVGEPSIRRTDI